MTEWRRLEEVATIHAGGRLQLSGNDFVAEGVPAYGAAGLNGYLRSAEYVDESAVILSSIGARCGKAFLVNGSWTSLANTQVILPHAEVDPTFLWYQLNDETRWPRSGSAQPFIKPSDVKASEIWLPSVEEQRRIAAILDQADAIRTKRCQVLARLDALPQSTFRAMFERSSSAPRTRLGEQLDYLTSGSRGWAKYYSTEGSLFIRIQNVTRGRLDLSDVAFVHPPNDAEARRTRIQPGDVLLSITADLGRTGVVPSGIGAAHINQHLAILRTSRLEPMFLSAFLESSQGRRELMKRNRGQVKDGLNFEDVRSVEIPVPPRGLQREFAAHLSLISAQRALVQRALAADDELFASIQSRAFRGEL